MYRLEQRLRQLIREMIESQNLAFLGSVDGDGFPAIRAMLRPKKYDDLRGIWFTSHAPSDKIRDYTENPKACVYFCDAVQFRGVLLKGTIEIYDASEAERRLSTPGDTLYYPEGASAPGYVALKLAASSGRLYDQRRSEDFTLA